MHYIHTLRGNSKQECNCIDNGHGTGTVPTYHWTGHCITSIIFLQRSRDENCPNIYHWTGLTLHGFHYIPTMVTGRNCPIMLLDGTHTAWLPLYSYSGHGTELSHYATRRDSHCISSSGLRLLSWLMREPLFPFSPFPFLIRAYWMPAKG